MAVDTVTTDANRVYLPIDSYVINSSFSLRADSRSPFTLHYAIWPFAALFSLIGTVWFLVYVSTILSRRHISNAEHRSFTSLYATKESTNAGGYEASTVISPVAV